MSLTAKPTYKNTARVEAQTKPRRERVKDRRAVVSKQLQAIVEAWDAWNPDDMSVLEKWIDGCSRLEKAIDSARAEIGGGK